MPLRPFGPFLALVLALACMVPAHGSERVLVGSKRFTESYILGEIVAQAATRAGAQATHKPGLGNGAVVLEALKLGAIDVYPEYIGTIEREILGLPAGSDPARIDAELARMGLAVAVPLGFSNGYALATTGERARQLGLRTIGDLARHRDLAVAVSQEFLGRADGWPGLAAHYGLPQSPRGIDHGIAYDALARGTIAVTDIYTTDAKIAELGLMVLEDDRRYFPSYGAVLLYRRDLPQRAPQAWKAIAQLEGRIDTAAMIRMNGDAELRGLSFAEIARRFLAGDAAGGKEGAAKIGTWQALTKPDLGRLTREHLFLVLVSVGVATLLGIPLGGVAAAYPVARQPVLAVTGLLQTIPSLALLAALIPLMGSIGTGPAIVALTLYALLPIVRNTVAGLLGVPPGLRQAALSLGMTPWQRWRHVDLPLALPIVLAGVKTATVLTVGTATIAAFIGAGGYGERIAQGLALNDAATMYAGAIPSAALALLVQGAFEAIERLVGRQRR